MEHNWNWFLDQNIVIFYLKIAHELLNRSRFVELRIDEEGDFIDEWPGGFFEESFHEKFGGR